MECEELSIEHKKRKKLAFKLMKSEWFTELPEDLTENWFVKFCPDGFRVLIVAENVCAYVITKLIYLKFTFV